MTKERRLIVNADDLGLSRGITDGVLLAHFEGFLTSASLVVNQPATDYAVEQLRHVPKLGVGIHLNLSQGDPILSAREIPSLVTREGQFYPQDAIVRKLLRWQIPSYQIEAEFCAQIRRMKAHGLTPTHADSHHHLHLYPSVAGPFRRALEAEGIRRARSPRIRHWPRNGFIGGPHGGPIYRRLLVTAYMELLRSVFFRKLVFPDCRVDFHPTFQNNLELLSEGWRLTLKNLPTGTYELCCHPSLSEPPFLERDYFCRQRRLELRILTDPRFRFMIEENKIKLISFNEL